MSFIDHLEELRWHILRSLLAVLVFTIVAFMAKDWIFETLIFGPKKPEFWTYRFFCFCGRLFHMEGTLCAEPVKFEIINTDLSGQFMAHVQASLIFGVIFACPWIYYEIWKFVKPGLYEEEVRKTRGIILPASLLFFVGVLFGYYILIPVSINFLAGYQISTEISNAIRLSSYLEMISTLTLGSGLMFELPVTIYILAKLGLVTAGFLRTYRRWAILIILVIAAVITPPDVFSQLLVAIPVYALYELSIFLTMRVEKNLARKKIS